MKKRVQVASPPLLTKPQGDLLARKLVAFNQTQQAAAHAQQDLVELLVAYEIDPVSFGGYNADTRQVVVTLPNGVTKG